MVTKEKLQKK